MHAEFDLLQKSSDFAAVDNLVRVPLIAFYSAQKIDLETLLVCFPYQEVKIYANTQDNHSKIPPIQFYPCFENAFFKK